MLVVFKLHQLARISWLSSNQPVARGVVGARGSFPSLALKLVKSLIQLT